jgi:peptidoglycan hydrolase-like protein with peptidoglycan-binding domain
MRFREFVNIKLIEATKGNQADTPKFDMSGYFTVGDSHSNGVGNYGRGKTWKALGMDGASAFDPMHMQAIEKIPSGSVVAISLGANDLKGKPIPAIVAQVQKVINAAKDKVLQVVYLLPTTTAPNKPNDPKRDELRQALSAAINVPIEDLGQASPGDPMGLHLSSGGYNAIASRISKQYTPRAMGAKLGPSDQEPGAPTTKDRIQKSAELEQGPPFPPEQTAEVIKMQQSLQELGYSLGRLGVDGKYGPMTAAAVAAFKKDYGLTGTGSNFGKDGFDLLSQINAGQVKRVAASKPAAPTAKELPPLADDAVTKGKIGELLDLIAGPESRGHYDIMFGSRRHPEILDMTITELFQFQRDYKRGKITGKPMETAASGRYQFMPNTLAECVRGLGMNPNTEKFSPANQDKLIIYRLRSIRQLDQWLAGKIKNDQFMDNLAMEFASFPAPSKGGKSWYDKVGSNKAGVSVAAVDSKLDQIQAQA